MRPLVMGILNVTPDSFSDGGLFASPEQAIARAGAMIDEGADLIDVGGESTRPGAEPVPTDEELRRVMPVIEGLAGRVRISIDTRNGDVARVAVTAGATLINDVSASLGPVAAQLGVGYVAMHMLGDPRTMQDRPRYDDVVTEVGRFLVECADRASADGCTEVWIDPGFGFGKTEAHNRELLVRLHELVDSGYPVLVGLSRKRWIGAMHTRSDQRISDEPIGVVGTADRREGSVATATYAMMQGARMIRVHDVKAGWQAATVVAGTTEPARRVGEG